MYAAKHAGSALRRNVDAVVFVGCNEHKILPLGCWDLSSVFAKQHPWQETCSMCISVAWGNVVEMLRLFQCDWSLICIQVICGDVKYILAIFGAVFSFASLTQVTPLPPPLPFTHTHPFPPRAPRQTKKNSWNHNPLCNIVDCISFAQMILRVLAAVADVILFGPLLLILRAASKLLCAWEMFWLSPVLTSIAVLCEKVNLRDRKRKEQELCDFVDQYIVCAAHNRSSSVPTATSKKIPKGAAVPFPPADTSIPISPEIVGRNTHKHSRTCRRKYKKKVRCRFHIPLPPMRQTCVLRCFPEDEPEIGRHKKTWDRIQSLLQTMFDEQRKDSEALDTMTFDDFLKKLHLSEDEYLDAVRSSLTSNHRIFLRRAPNEIRINAYNPFLLSTWEANMDIQLVTDMYGCAQYIAGYVTKGHGGTVTQVPTSFYFLFISHISPHMEHLSTLTQPMFFCFFFHSTNKAFRSKGNRLYLMFNEYLLSGFIQGINMH